MPRVTAYGPPCAMTSSPSTMMLSSRAISSCKASRRASRRLIFGMSFLPFDTNCSASLYSLSLRERAGVRGPAGHRKKPQTLTLTLSQREREHEGIRPHTSGILIRIDVFEQFVWCRIGTALGKTHCLLDCSSGVLLNLLILGIREDPGFFQ